MELCVCIWICAFVCIYVCICACVFFMFIIAVTAICFTIGEQRGVMSRLCVAPHILASLDLYTTCGISKIGFGITLYLYSLLVDGFPLILPWIQWTKFSGYATHGDGDADLHSIRGRVHIMHPVWCPSTGPACCQHLGRLFARPGPVQEPLLLDPASRMSLLGTLWMLIPSPNNRVCFPWTSQSPSK